MSTTTCTHCNGWGTVCSRCGKPRRRKQKSWFESSGCGCYRAKLHSCPDHKQSSWSCDICGVTRPGATKGDSYVGQIGSTLSVCSSCKAIADAAESVAVEQVLERRTGVANVAEAGERLVVERLRAELTWWREWGNRASHHLGVWSSSSYTALEERAELRREAFTRGRVKLEDIEMGRVAPGTAPAPPVAHATATGGEAVPGGGGTEGGAAAP